MLTGVFKGTTKLVFKFVAPTINGSDSDSNTKSPVVASMEYNFTKISVPTVVPEAPPNKRTLIAFSVWSAQISNRFPASKPSVPFEVDPAAVPLSRA